MRRLISDFCGNELGYHASRASHVDEAILEKALMAVPDEKCLAAVKAIQDKIKEVFVGKKEDDNIVELPRPTDLRVRRGLGVLESLIQEKNPDFFKIQTERRHAFGMPFGIPSQSVVKRVI